MSYIGKINAGGTDYKVGSTLYGTCDTSADTAAKVAVVEGFDTLENGVTVHIRFTNSNTAINILTLAIKPSANGTPTAAKQIIVRYISSNNVEIPGGTEYDSWKAGSIISFTYYNNYWYMNDFRKVTAVYQGNTTTDADYRVLLSNNADDTDGIYTTRKSSGLTFNPSKKALTLGSRESGSTVGTGSIALGNSVTSSGAHSCAEGTGTIASGEYSHAEGVGTIASGTISHTEGDGTTASGRYSHAEGGGTTASGFGSHTEGESTTASGSFSHAQGYATTANHKSQHVFGEWNIADPSTATATARGNYVEIVGNGTKSSAKSNARTLDWDGNEWLAGGLTIGNPDTAEYTGLKYDGSRGALTIVGGQQYSGAAFYEPILTVKNNSQTMGTASINITPENIYFQGDTWDGTNASLKDAISSLNSRYNIYVGRVTMSYKSSTQLTGSVKLTGHKLYDGVITMVSMSGTPYTQVTRLTQDSGGSTDTMTFSAWGSGFVSGHVLVCNVICRVEDA